MASSKDNEYKLRAKQDFMNTLYDVKESGKNSEKKKILFTDYPYNISVNGSGYIFHYSLGFMETNYSFTDITKFEEFINGILSI